MNNNNLPNMVPPIPNQNQENNNLNQLPNQDLNSFPGVNYPQAQNNNMVNNGQNTFINYNANPSENKINDLIVEGSYNKLESIPYANDARVIQNIEETKKKTVTISKELKTVIVLAIILFLVILFMPNISEFINGLRFN